MSCPCCSVNPARGFGPAVVSRTFHQYWIFWVGPLVGATIACVIYQSIFRVRVSHPPIATLCACVAVAACTLHRRMPSVPYSRLHHSYAAMMSHVMVVTAVTLRTSPPLLVALTIPVIMLLMFECKRSWPIKYSHQGTVHSQKARIFIKLHSLFSMRSLCSAYAMLKWWLSDKCDV